MTFQDYLDYFEQLLQNPQDYELYQDEEYLNYTKMNWARMNRWLKRFEPTNEVKSVINGIAEDQHWIVITEPWCGDAAHSVAQLYQMVKNNPHIDFEIQLRDGSANLIDDYLTNDAKSIPKLIIRNDVGHDKFIWGPRPAALQVLFDSLKAEGKSLADIKEQIQKWYNEDKGMALQQEIINALT